MGLEERVEKLAGWVENAPLPVKFAVKTVATVAFPFAWVGYKVARPVISLLPREGSVKLLGAEGALSSTKRTSLLEVGVGAADIAYELVTGDPFLPGYGLLSSYLLADGVWRYSRASAAVQQFYKNFTFFGGKEPKPSGTLALELPAAVLRRVSN